MATKLVSMKIDRKAQTEAKAALMDAPDPPAYPYGLEVRLDDDSLEKLGVDADDYSAGDELMIIAKVKVSSVSSRDNIIGGATQNMELQITELCLEDLPDAKAEKKDVATSLYGKA